jgi:Ca2+-transporting ATPase
MEALRKIGRPSARVRRDGQDGQVETEQIVPGDVLVLDAGDVAAADMRVVEASGLKVDESALTGESVTVPKDTQPVEPGTDLADRQSMIFKGTVVTEGSGRGLAVATGMDTELGRISELAEGVEEEETPLERRLGRLGRRMAALVMVAAAVSAVAGIWAGQQVRLIIATSVALGVAAVPEGLPIVANLALARGMWLMARRNAVINRLPAVETLGATDLIFTDKTGTLTENRMTLRKIVTPSGEFAVRVGTGQSHDDHARGEDDPPGGDDALADHGEDQADRSEGDQPDQFESPEQLDDPLARRTIEIGVLCSNAALADRAEQAPAGDDSPARDDQSDAADKPGQDARKPDADEQPEGDRPSDTDGRADRNQSSGQGDQGDPTEIALLRAGREAGMARADLLADRPEVREVSFDPDMMMMATFHRAGDGLELAVKGAPRSVLETCTRQATGDGEDSQPLEDDARKRWLDRADELAGEGLRVLAMADRRVDDEQAEPYEDLRFVGLVGLYDPPREGVGTLIDACHQGGIGVVMVTGDQWQTAKAIARAVEITDDDGAEVMEGGQLPEQDDQPDAETREKILNTRVFARFSPAQKLRLIDLFQSDQHVVAMTGDGINDAPALKTADIGVAMGRRGTDAAREAADMVLQDDAFETIVAAVRQGRVIFENIRRSVLFMLCTNLAEVVAVAVASVAGAFTGLPLPLLPLQILYLNVLTDVFPALALAVGRGGDDVMDRPPRPSGESVLTARHWREIGGWSLVVAASVLGASAVATFVMGLPELQAITVSFLTLAFGKLWFTFVLRAPGTGLLRNDVVRNPWVWAALALCIPLLLAAVYLPGLSDVLRTEGPGAGGWALLLGFSLIPFAVGQAVRAWQANRPETID